jgi:hypothetical protein
MSSKKNQLNSIRDTQRTFLNRDYESFKSSLTQYARTFFSDKLSDFSQNGFAGMLIELNSYVGDVMSYYMDHQFQELDLTQAVETKNVERLIRNTGVKITGASPATVVIDFYIEIPSTLSDGNYIPDLTLSPIIKAGTILSSGAGIKFTLLDDLDMGETRFSGEMYATYVTMNTDDDGNPTSFSLKRSGLCSSASTTEEQFTIPNSFKAFRTITLGKANVSEVISIIDSEGNEWYEVNALPEDTVFRRVVNTSDDVDLVSENLELIPAPRRFVASTSNMTKKMTIRFGGGSALSTDDDIMPDPSELSLPLYGRRTTLSNFTIDPNKLLSTTTLGVSPQNTTLTVSYRHGGGISHNVSEGSISTVSTLVTKFNQSVSTTIVSSIRASLEVTNVNPAEGGENAPSLNELRSIAISHRNSQMRIVTKQDLIARIYTMPNVFGRVFRVGVRSNPNNPLATVVAILSRDLDGNLVNSPDTLKENLRIFLNESRLISDALDIVDTPIFDIGVTYGITVSGNANPDSVIQKANENISEYLQIENFQIGSPIMVSDIVNIILNTQDVVSLVDLNVSNLTGEIGGNQYSESSFSVTAYTSRGIIECPEGGIFEVKFPDDDIVGTAR